MGSRARDANGATSTPPARARFTTPPRIHRQLDKAARVLTTDAVVAAQRQRQFDRLVLSQIVTRADQIRQRARSHGKTPFGRPLHEAQDDDRDAWSDATPLTLIELIQASSAVFTTHGICAPQDAMYHRFLLTLSMDPERDWAKKLQRFGTTTAQQPPPRIIQRTHQHGDSRSTSANGEDGSQQRRQQQRGSMVAKADVGKKKQTADHFSDVLLTSPTSNKNGKQSHVRMASSVATTRATTKKPTNEKTAEHKLRELRLLRTQLEDLTEELEKGERDKEDDDNAMQVEEEEEEQEQEQEEEVEEEADSGSEQLKEKDAEDRWEEPSDESAPVSPVNKTASVAIRPTDRRRSPKAEETPPARRVSMATFQLLATSFQQWKELMAFHRLVRESRARELRLTQSLLPPIATFAVFRWIAITLPRRSADNGFQDTEMRAIPTFVAARGVAVHSSALLARFTGRVLVWTMQRVLRSWAKHARASKTLRIRAMIRARTHVLERASECLYQWRLFARQRKRVRDHGVWVETLHGRKCTRLAIRRWQAALHTQQQETMASVSYDKKRLRRVLAVWSEWTKGNRRANSSGARALLKRVLRSWRRAAIDARANEQLRQQADVWRTKRVVRTYWVCWRTQWARNKSIRETLLKWRHQRDTETTRQLWTLWKQVHATSHTHQQLRTRLVSHRRARVLRTVVGAWAAFTQRRRCCELLVMDAMNRRETRLVCHVWRVWTTQYTPHSTREDEARNRAVQAQRRLQIWQRWKRHTRVVRVATKLRGFCDHGIRAQAWQTWRSNVAKRREYRLIVQTWCGDREVAVKHHVFQAFAANRHVSKQKQHVATAFTDRGSRRRVQLCLWAWQETTLARSTQHHQDAAIVLSVRSQRIQSLWSRWRQTFHVAQCVHMADVAMANGLQKRYLAKWRRYLTRKRSVALQIQELYAFRLRRTLIKWRLRMATMQSLRIVHSKVRDHAIQSLLERGWRGWLSSFSTIQSHHVRVAKAVFAWQNRRLQATFERWKTAHEKRRQHQQTLAKWWQTARDRSVRACWHAWRLCMELQHEQRTVVANAAQFHDQRRLKKTIRAWRLRCQHAQGRLCVMTKCVELWTNSQRRHTFVRWKNYTHTQQRCREMDTRANHQRLVSCFKAWTQWKTGRDAWKSEQAHVAAQLLQWRATQAIQRLRFHALASKRLASILGNIKISSSSGLKVVFFRRWTQFIAQNRQTRAATHATIRHLQRYRQQRCVYRWSTVVRVKKLLLATLLQAKNRTSEQNTRKTFTKWRQFVAQRRLFHALQQKAVVFRVFCVLPIYFCAWKRFLQTQTHRKTLVLHASRLLSHRYEAKAFKTWSEFTKRAQQSRKALTVWQNQRLIQYFTRWRALRGIQRATATATTYFETKLQRRILKKWRQHVHRKTLLRHFTQLWHTQTTCTCFGVWLRRTKATKCARSLLHRLQNTTLGRIFNAWKAQIQSQISQTGQIQYRFVLLWNRDRQMTSFQRWKALKHRQQLLKARLRRRLEQQTSTCFRKWQSLVADHKTLGRRATQLTHQWHERVVSRSWQQWKREKVRRDAVNRLCKRVVGRASGVLLRQLVRKWHSVASKATVVRDVALRWHQRRVGRIFMAWYATFVLQRRRERGVAAQIQQRHATYLLRHAMATMRTRVAIKRVCTTLFLPWWQRHVATQIWHAWHAWHIRKQTTKALVRKWQQQLQRADPDVAEMADVSMRKWRALVPAQCFSHWFTAIQTQKWMRQKTLVALQRWRSQRLAVCFKAWHAWRDTRAWQNRIWMRNAMARRARAWQRWRAFHKTRHARQRAQAQAHQLRRRRVQVAVLFAWRQRLATQRHIQLVQAALVLGRTRRSIRQWHERTVHQHAHRLQLTVARVAFHHKLQVAAWHKWTLFASHVRRHRQELQQNTERLQVLVMCSSFRAWRAHSQRQHKINRVVALLSGKCDAKTATRVLVAWQKYTRTKQELHTKAQAFLAAKAMAKGLLGLQNNVKTRKLRANALFRATKWTDLLHGRHTERLFRLWKRFTRLSLQSKHVIRQYHLLKLLPSVFHAWRTATQANRDTNQRLARAVDRWRSLCVQRAWRSWVLYRSCRLESYQTLATARAFATQRRLRRVWVAWRATFARHTLMSESCRKLLVRWRMQTVYRCFMGWQSLSLQRKTRNVAAALVTGKLLTRQLRSCWSEWRRQFIVLKVGQRKRLVRMWTRWQHWRQQRLAWLAFQEKQRMVLLETVRARHGLRQWRAFVVQTKLFKTMAVLCGRFQKETLVRRVFEHWLAFLVVRHKEKATMKRVLVWFHQRQLMQSFQALDRNARYRKDKKERLVMAQAHHQRRSMSSMFTAWRFVARTSQQQRQKLRAYVGVMQHVTQRRSFHAWREFTERRVEIKATCAALLTQRSLVTTQSVFQIWQLFSDNAKHKRLAHEQNAVRLARASLRQWHRFVVLTKMERMLGASAQRLLERGFVEWRKRAHVRKTARLFTQHRQQRDDQETLSKVFQSWSKWSRLQAKCASLLANVAVGNHLRFRFLMWKSFSHQRLRLKRLVHSPPVDPSVASGRSLEVAVAAAEPPPAAVQLARMARIFQRFQVDWRNLSTVWQRWRHGFHAALFFRMRRLHKCFVAWQTWSQRRRLVKTLVVARLRCHRSQQLTRVLRAWRDVVQTVKRIQRERRRERELLVIVNTELQRQERKTLQRHWVAWRARVDAKQHLLQSVTWYQRARVLTKFWLLWSHDFVKSSKQEKQIQQLRVDAIAKLRMARAVQRLQTQAQRKRHVRCTRERLRWQRETRQRRTVFEKWHVVANVARRARLLAVFKQRQRVRNAMAEWIRWLQVRHQQLRAMDLFVCGRQRNVQTQTLAKWRRFLQHRRQQEDKIATAVAFRIRNMIRKRWRRATQRQLVIRAKQHHAQTALCDWRQRRSLAKWHRTAHAIHLRRTMRAFVLRKFLRVWKSDTQNAIALRFDAVRGRKSANRVLCAWQFVASERVWQRRVYKELLGSRQTRLCRQLWLRWRRFVESKRKAKLALTHYNSTITLKWFLHWLDEAHDRQRQREDRLELAMAFHTRHAQRRVVRHWVVAVHAHQQRRAVLLICMMKIQRALHNRLQKVLLRAWAETTELARYSRACEAELMERRVRQSLQTWRYTIADRKRWKQKQRDAQAYYRQRLLSAPFFHWQNYALAWKDAQRSSSNLTASKAKAKPKAKPKAIQVPRQAVRVRNEGEEEEEEDGEEEEEEGMSFRRPLSPMAKRFQNKRKMLQEQLEVDVEEEEDDNADQRAPRVPCFSEAATLSLDVKKRLLVLGKWKPSHKSLHQV